MSMYKKIYFVGIKGVGMTSLALIANEAGVAVRGSDIEQEFITDDVLKKNKISVFHGFEADDLISFIGESQTEEVLLITTSAHGGFDNPQVLEASKRAIKILTHGQAVGEFMKGNIFGRDFTGISIAGSHGKTTISGMLSTALSLLGEDPSYSVGTSELFPLGNPGHFGSGKYFVVEADEYVSEIQYDRKPKLLYQFPKIEIINNIDYDHPDYYNSIEEIEEVFYKFMAQVQNDGFIVVNGDDRRIGSLLARLPDKKVITCGIGSDNDYSLGDYKENGRSITFQVHKKKEGAQDYILNIPGVHNTLNALTVIAVLETIGYEYSQIARVIAQFTGTKRRFEVIGEMKNGAILIDDYAHHPEEITKTLSAARLAYPDKKIICIFQPHTLSRTEALLSDFSLAFAGIDCLVLLPVFITQREANVQREEINILEEFRKNNSSAVLLSDRLSVIKYVSEHSTPDSLILTMGAGDVYQIGKSLKDL